MRYRRGNLLMYRRFWAIAIEEPAARVRVKGSMMNRVAYPILLILSFRL